MKALSLIIISIICILLWSSCQKVITPPLAGSSPQLVIIGTVSDTTGPYHVKISNTVSFYADNIYPNVSGASVTITDQTTGISDVLTETSAGTYTTHTLTGRPGDTYQLQVLLNGKTYRSSSTMPYPVPLDSITFDYAVKNKIQPVVYFQDPTGFTNYYKLAIQVNGTNLKRFEAIDDRLSNSKYIHAHLEIDTGIIKRNDLVNVSLVGVEKNAYQFLQEAENVAFNNDNLAAPATPTSNISGGCLGYFSAQTVSSKKRIVK
ncbi:DUF4249 domain-containing protein [Mucilaginibacter sp. UR6-11]|uniref:DUF4249 domain-containing protein n=1 Tax=Mucilaginibacter sp. UR6-11 TaxID=1435644 RepID=UPI001E2A2A08|nr:DUF4249 domain-containing protein [Mucilaginibacter sp. UR6-11]MCC8423479.1 DUF4249 domain-containing protein [Mucilaginibacter sp. UR6-11]